MEKVDYFKLSLTHPSPHSLSWITYYLLCITYYMFIFQLCLGSSPIMTLVRRKWSQIMDGWMLV